MTQHNMQLYLHKNLDNPARVIDGEAVVVTPGDSLLHSLNEQATFIWSLADGQHQLKGIAASLCETYEVEATQAETDLLDFVALCVEKNLLSLDEKPSQEPSSSAE